MNKGIPFVKVADRVEVTVAVEGKMSQRASMGF